MPQDYARAGNAPNAEKAAFLKNLTTSPVQGAEVATGCSYDGPCRERTGRELLTDLYLSKVTEADEITDLLKALPQELPYRADRALRRLIQK